MKVVPHNSFDPLFSSSYIDYNRLSNFIDWARRDFNQQNRFAWQFSGEFSRNLNQILTPLRPVKGLAKVPVVFIARNAWTSLVIHCHRSGKYECERALNSPELEEKGPKLDK